MVKRTRQIAREVEHGKAPAIQMFDQRFPRNKVHVIEGEFAPLDTAGGDVIQRSIFFDHGDGCGDFLAVYRDSTCHGQMRADGSDVQVRQPIYTSAVARWKHYEKHLEPLKRGLRDGGLDVDGL